MKLRKCLIENIIIFQISVKFHSYWNNLRSYDMEKTEWIMVFNKLIFWSLNSNFRIFLYFLLKVRIIPEMTLGYISKVHIISKQVMCISFFFFFFLRHSRACQWFLDLHNSRIYISCSGKHYAGVPKCIIIFSVINLITSLALSARIIKVFFFFCYCAYP